MDTFRRRPRACRSPRTARPRGRAAKKEVADEGPAIAEGAEDRRAAGQAARRRAGYQEALERLGPLHHRAARLDEKARVLKGTLAECELRELRRAWSGV
jgi:hypothetical protein